MVRVIARSVAPEASVLGVQVPLCALVFIFSSCKGTIHVGVRPTLMTSFHLDFLFKDVFSITVTC